MCKRVPEDLEVGLNCYNDASAAHDAAAEDASENIQDSDFEDVVENAPEDLEVGVVSNNERRRNFSNRLPEHTSTLIAWSWTVLILQTVKKAFRIVKNDKDNVSMRSRAHDQASVHYDHPEAEPANESATSPPSEFEIGLDELVRLVKDRSLEALNRYNGVHGLSTLLKTDLKVGIDRRDDEILHRRHTFGSNRYPCRKGKSFWCFLWRASQFPHLLVIMLAAVFYLLLPIYTKADVSLAMGIGGTAAAKENSDIIILDNTFARIVKCIIWSRSLYTNVQRSILFRLTVSVSALAICVVEVVVYDAFPLNAVQLLMLNLIIDILGALALAYRPRADHHLMGKPPVGIRDPLITNTMWSKLIIQVFYLVLSLVVINSEKLLKLKHGHTGNAEKVMNTFIFNSFVFCLVLSEFEIESVDQTLKEILRENMFLVTITSTIISQIILMEFAGIFISSVRLDLKKWATTSLLGLLSQVATRYPYPANQYYRN